MHACCIDLPCETSDNHIVIGSESKGQWTFGADTATAVLLCDSSMSVFTAGRRGSCSTTGVWMITVEGEVRTVVDVLQLHTGCVDSS